MSIPAQLRYSEEHEWVKMDGDIAIVGITDYAQEELADVTFIELPELGTQVEEKGSIAVIESVTTTSHVYSPVSGSVVEINTQLEEDPIKVNEDPYGEGWLFKIKIDDMEIVEGLLSADDYEELLG